MALLQNEVKYKDSKNRINVLGVILLIFLILYTISLFTPILWAVMSAFKSKWDYQLNSPIALPEKWVWNFSEVFKVFKVRVHNNAGPDYYVNMPMMYVYSILYAVGCSFFNAACIGIAAYACARFPFRFSKVMHTTVIIVMVVPIVGNLPSEIRMARMLGLFDHIWGLWLMRANFLGMYFLVFYGMFKQLPMAYTEAAKVDGAGNLRIMLRIVLPLVKYTFFTVVLINFITYWNDYQVPLIYIPSYPTVAYGMYVAAYSTENLQMSNVPMRMSAAILMLAPILVVFCIFQKRLLGNLTMGGLKG